MGCTIIRTQQNQDMVVVIRKAPVVRRSIHAANGKRILVMDPGDSPTKRKYSRAKSAKRLSKIDKQPSILSPTLSRSASTLFPTLSKSESVLGKRHSVTEKSGNRFTEKIPALLGLTSSSAWTSEMITSALLKKKNAIEARTHLSLAKIILKAHKLRTVHEHVVQVFKTVALEYNAWTQEDGLSLDGLEDCMNQLHGQLEKEDIKQLFNFVDIHERKTIDLKEFWVALTVGYILEAIPALVNRSVVHLRVEPVQLNVPQTISFIGHQDSFQAFLEVSEKIMELLNLIVAAYLLFDTEGKGYFDLEAFGNVLEGDSVTLEIKFQEMNGTVDFGEFVLTFFSWIGDKVVDDRDSDSDSSGGDLVVG